jgi:hypothetical protein
MRALATIAALLLAALQVLVGLVMLGSASSVVWG